MTPDDVPALLRVFGDAEVMRFYPAPFDEARMQRWVAWNQQHYAEHGHGLWAVILRATGECWLLPHLVDGVPEACFPKPEPIGRRMGAAEWLHRIISVTNG
jgi:RimJ/RimL family protein N-acetyltransferase